MNKLSVLKKKLWTPRDQDDVPPLGTPHILASFFNEDFDGNSVGAPTIEMVKYSKLLELLPDKVVSNLESARLERAGYGAMLKAGLGYEEVLASVIVDGTAIASSSTEAFLFPALKFPANYLQPGGIPGRTMRWRARGRQTTLTTAGTLTFKFGHAVTNVIPTTTWCVSGALTMDATLQTATQWCSEGEVVVRSVGSGGTVYAQGVSKSSASAYTIANETASYMGSAGSATPAAATVDMTVDLYVSLTGKWSLSTAYSITGHIFVVEALN